MQRTNSYFKTTQPDRPKLLVLCLSFSLLLHLLVVFSLPYILQNTPNRFLAEKPTFVRLVDKPEPKPKPDKPAEYELDQKPSQLNERKPENSKRLAEHNQRVKKEQAPKGIDDSDRPARRAIPSLPPTAVAPQPQKPVNRKEPIEKKSEITISSDKNAQKSLPQKSPAAKQETAPKEQSPKQLPTLEQLTKLTPNTLDRLRAEEKSSQEKIKQRDDVEQGDEVWLNLEQGLLISFFRRFRNQIEGVWNYPRKAVDEGVEGILLLKITVNRKGELLDVDLLNSSGSDLLDNEAIQAVYFGAPFGPLPKQYPHQKLKIYAHFRYQIFGKYIYGR